MTGDEPRALKDSTLIARIDERTLALQRAVIELKDTIGKQYVTQGEFAPVKRVVYGMVSLVLLTICGAVLAMVLKTAGNGT